MNKFIIFLFLICLSCSKETLIDESFLEKIQNKVWTRGSNYKVFKNNPFRLILVEEGTCLEFNEAPKIVEDNQFEYTILENQNDTLRLGYNVSGANVNHCGTFTYYLKSDGNLVRSYEECGETFYKDSFITEFYSAQETLTELCPNI